MGSGVKVLAALELAWGVDGRAREPRIGRSGTRRVRAEMFACWRGSGCGREGAGLMEILGRPRDWAGPRAPDYLPLLRVIGSRRSAFLTESLGLRKAVRLAPVT